MQQCNSGCQRAGNTLKPKKEVHRVCTYPLTRNRMYARSNIEGCTTDGCVRHRNSLLLTLPNLNVTARDGYNSLSNVPLGSSSTAVAPASFTFTSDLPLSQAFAFTNVGFERPELGPLVHRPVFKTQKIFHHYRMECAKRRITEAKPLILIAQQMRTNV